MVKLSSLLISLLFMLTSSAYTLTLQKTRTIYVAYSQKSIIPKQIVMSKGNLEGRYIEINFEGTSCWYMGHSVAKLVSCDKVKMEYTTGSFVIRFVNPPEPYLELEALIEFENVS